MTTKLEVPVGPRDHLLGDPHAPVVLVEYGDYQCSHCGRAYPIVQELRRRFGASLAFVFRNFPLTDLHPDALRAAETAEWAGRVRGFWRMHDHLFQHQHELGRAQLMAAAQAMGFDERDLQVAWHERSLRARIAEDVASGMASGVRGTPTFFINGVRFDVQWSFDELADALRAAGARDGG